jgi:hypothetical protein
MMIDALLTGSVLFALLPPRSGATGSYLSEINKASVIVVEQKIFRELSKTIADSVSKVIADEQRSAQTV